MDCASPDNHDWTAHRGTTGVRTAEVGPEANGELTTGDRRTTDDGTMDPYRARRYIRGVVGVGVPLMRFISSRAAPGTPLGS